MLNLNKVNQVVGGAASAVLKSEFNSVHAQTKVNGDAALDTIVMIQRELQKFGEERFPIIEFVTEDELASDGDT